MCDEVVDKVWQDGREKLLPLAAFGQDRDELKDGEHSALLTDDFTVAVTHLRGRLQRVDHRPDVSGRRRRRGGRGGGGGIGEEREEGQWKGGGEEEEGEEEGEE